MKVHKLVCLDEWIAKKLNDEDNQSRLINELLTNHYKDNKTEEEIIEEVKGKIIEKEKEEAYKKRQEAINKRVKKAVLEEVENGKNEEDGG